MASEQIQIRLGKAGFSRADMDAKAEKMGMTQQELALKGIELILELDTSFYKKIEEYAKGLKIPFGIVMQNMIIKQMAKNSAVNKVWGPAPQILEEFITTDKGTLTGDALFKVLEDLYVRQEKAEKDHRPYKEKDDQ